MIMYLWMLLMIGLVNGQMSPTWVASPYIESDIITITNNVAISSGTYSKSLTYIGTRSNPQVIIAMVDLVFLNLGSMGLTSSIQFNMGTTGFTTSTVIQNSTSVSLLRLRYLAYDGGIFGTAIRIQYIPTLTNVNNTGASIHTNNGTLRTAILSLGLFNAGGNPLNTANNWICLSYLIGFRARSNNLYGITVSCDKSTSTLYTLTVSVHNNTELDYVVVYNLFVDLTSLQNTLQHFVDYSVTNSQFGVQQTFFNPPFGIFSNEYLHGIKSISFKNNVIFNFTVNNTLFSTPASSQYDQTSHFNVRVRKCNVPYIYFNKNDYLCYSTCPIYTYLVANSTLCNPCHYSCYSCSNSTACLTCKTNFLNNTFNSLCQCIPYYYLNNQQCLPCYYTCLTCHSPATISSCDTCQSAMMRTHNNTISTCECMVGYYDVGVVRCKQICGDGLVNGSACDDGNTIDGDGCSSSCTIQPNFTCNSTPSVCYYHGTITIRIARIQKLPYSNTANFYIQITPYLNLMSKQITVNNIISNTSLSLASVTSLSPYLVFTGSYSQNMESKKFQISVTPSASGPLSTINTSTVIFDCYSSNALLLEVVDDYTYSSSLKFYYACQIIGYIIISMSIIFPFTTHKQIGNETFFIMQMMFMCLQAIKTFNPIMVAVGQLNSVMGYNNILGLKQYPFLTPPSLIFMGYSSFYEYNVNLMVLFQGIALIMYIIYVIYCKICKNGINRKMWRWLKLFRFQFLIYWTFINMNQIVISVAIQATNRSITNVGIYLYQALCIISVIVSVIVVCFKSQTLPSYYRDLYTANSQPYTFRLILFGMLLMDITLLISSIIYKQVFYALLLIPTLFLIYLPIYRPFKLLLNNIRFFFNYLLLLIVMLLYVVLINSPTAHLYTGVGVLVCMLLVFFLNVGCWIYTIVNHFQDKIEIVSISDWKQLNELKSQMDRQTKLRKQQMGKIHLDEQTEKGFNRHLNESIYYDKLNETNNHDKTIYTKRKKRI